MNPEIQNNVSLARFTTMKIGGPAEFFAIANTPEQLIHLAQQAKKNSWPFRVIGKGSNILISDHGVKGLTMINNSTRYSFSPPHLMSDSGISLGVLVSEAVKRGLKGLETLAGIPATFGGAIHHNAGTKLGEMKDVIEKVEIYDCKKEKVRWLSKKECDFQYRKSLFSSHPELLILRGTCMLSPEEPEKLQLTLQENLRYKHGTQTYQQPTLGCTFKNYRFKNEGDKNKSIQKGLAAGIKNDYLYTGWLIEHLGLKGYTLGNVQISEKHANFIINLGKGTAEHVIMLISLIKQKARDTYGIQLQEEIEYVGF